MDNMNEEAARIDPSMPPDPRLSLEGEIRQIINRHSAENASGTPDFILARYLVGCLSLFDMSVRKRDDLLGMKPRQVDGYINGKAI